MKRYLTIALVAILTGSPIQPAQSLNTSSNLIITQEADIANITWSYGKVKPESQILSILDSDNNLVKEVSIKKSVRKLKISGLSKDKTYTAKLVSKKPSRIYTTQFLLEPLLKVNKIDLSVGASSVRVNWDITDLNKDYIDGYLISAKTKNLPEIVVKLSKSYTGYTLQNISKNREYTISVQVLTAAGYGDKVITTLESLIPKAPTLSVSPLTATSVKLQWVYEGIAPNKQVVKISSLEGLARDGEEITLDGTVRELIIDKLTTSSTYRFRIFGENSHGVGAISAPVDKLLLPPTLAPTNFTAVVGSANESNVVTLKWLLPVLAKNVSSFRIDYKRSDETTWGRLVELPSNSLIHEISSLLPGYLYQFRIQSVSATGESEWVQTQAAPSGLASAPTAPVLTALEGGFTATWVVPVSTGVITAYLLEYSIAGSSSSTQIELPATTLSRTISGLVSGNYQVRVAAKTSAGFGPFTQFAYVQPFAKAQPPTTVSAVAGTLTNLGKILTSWQPPADTGGLPILNYILQYNASGTWVTHSTVSPSVTNVTISGLTPGTRYSFRVITVTSAGQSIPSDGSASATVLGLPLAPTSLTVTVTNTSGVFLASLSWVAPLNTGGSAITGYAIEVTYNGVTTDKPSQGAATSTEPFLLGSASNLGTYTFKVKSISDIGVGTEFATTTYTAS